MPNEGTFAKKLGVSRNGIVKALTREVTFSENLADLIVTKFPEIRKDWLLNEDGDMLNSFDDAIMAEPNVELPPKNNAELGRPNYEAGAIEKILQYNEELLKTVNRLLSSQESQYEVMRVNAESIKNLTSQERINAVIINNLTLLELKNADTINTLIRDDSKNEERSEGASG